ncbi:MAG: PD-(D/E)XK nuclease family protein [bacterium]
MGFSLVVWHILRYNTLFLFIGQIIPANPFHPLKPSVPLVYDACMHRISFSSAEQLQDWIIRNTGPQDIVLTPGGRMARQILRRFRQVQLTAGACSWLPIRVMSLNQWIGELWRESWSDFRPASPWRCMMLWRELVRRFPPPVNIFEGFSLAKGLDGTYAALVRHLLDTDQRRGTSPLVQWSSELINRFTERLSAEGLIHPAEMPGHLSRFLHSETARCAVAIPGRILLAGLRQSSPVEHRLFDCLDHITRVEWLEITDSPEARCTGVALPDPLQEVEWIAEHAVESSRDIPAHRIGIAVTDMEAYGGLFERVLTDLLGVRHGEAGAYFNITMGKPLTRSPLVQAGLLPLRLAMGGRERLYLVSLLLSPHYGRWASQRHALGALDRVWRRENVEGDLDRLIRRVRTGHPREASVLEDLIASLAPLRLHGARYPLGEWNSHLRAVWGALEFPVRAGEEDQVSWDHLDEGMGALERDTGDEPMGLGEYVGWLSHLCSETLFSVRGYEDAGLQIMGLIEARGLCFDRLFIPGMVSGLLPQPSRPFPFLTSEERARVQGGTPEGQYQFGRLLFDQLCASATEVTLTRPEQRETEPLVQSPFWPHEQTREAVDLWNTGSTLWAGCRWLAQTRRGAEHKEGAHAGPSQERCPDEVPIPPVVSATALEQGITCPFRFFALSCLGIEPLDEPGPGISPRARGEMVHRCLSRLVKEVLRQGLDLCKQWDQVTTVLKEQAAALLAPLADEFSWHVELRRWLEDDPSAGETGGLLPAWLAQERDAWDQGFRWDSTEVSFSNLEPPGASIRISGRIDRVDRRPEGGYICWDYKTGKVPAKKDVEELWVSQLLPYLLALRTGHTPIVVSSGTPLFGGYIGIDVAGDIRSQDFSLTAEDWSLMLSRWEERVAGLIAGLKEGDVAPSPRPAPTRKDRGACAYCPVRTLCGYEFSVAGE